MKARYKAQNNPQIDDNGNPITQREYLASLTDEQRTKFNTDMKNWIFDDFNGTGQTFRTSKTSDTRAAALNTQRKEKKELTRSKV